MIFALFIICVSTYIVQGNLIATNSHCYNLVIFILAPPSSGFGTRSRHTEESSTHKSTPGSSVFQTTEEMLKVFYI